MKGLIIQGYTMTIIIQGYTVISKTNKNVVRLKYLHLLLRSTRGYNQTYKYRIEICGNH